MENAVQEIVAKQVLTVAKAVEDKLDEEIEALDRLDLDDLEVLRERRLQQMKKMAEKRKRWISLGHGEYSEIHAEKDFFSIVKASERVVCHFYRDNWPCKVMDKHLSILAKQHIETRFVKINAEKSPYLAEKLRIVVLPTLALIKNAKVDDYVVGFDELGGTDEFSTEELEERLAKTEVIVFEGESSRILSKSNAQAKKSVRQSSNPAAASDGVCLTTENLSRWSFQLVIRCYMFQRNLEVPLESISQRSSPALLSCSRILKIISLFVDRVECSLGHIRDPYECWSFSRIDKAINKSGG